MAGATTLVDLASAIGTRTEESAVIAELKAGSEEAYSWLIGEFHQPIYSLIYRIALHEAANRKRWWFRHKAQETPIEPTVVGGCEYSGEDRLVDPGESPFEKFAHTEVRAAVDEALQQVPEPYRTALILRDLEEMSYEEIADVLAISLGTVKSRITRGRDALRKKLAGYVREVGPELGLLPPDLVHNLVHHNERRDGGSQSLREGSRGGREVEVTP